MSEEPHPVLPLPVLRDMHGQIIREFDILRVFHFYDRLRGYEVQEGYGFDRARHPYMREAWAGACAAQLLLTDTDPNDALQEEEEGGAQ